MTPVEKSLARYVTNPTGNVFALKNLPEEVAAVLFAYYSRSTEGLRENLLRLLDEGDLAVGGPAAGDDKDGADAADDAELAQAREKARAFHEKWVVGYGHSSVAEHAVVKLAVENVSILASKAIEDCRLASYTEKSTRYVAFDPSKAIYPEKVMASAAGPIYKKTIERLMTAYETWMTPVVAAVKERVPKTEKQTPRGYETACKSTACDMLRYLLPAAAFTNIGITVNARSLEGMISKLASHPLEEVQRLAGEIKTESDKIVPTLLKYADRNEYRAGRHQFGRPSPLLAVPANTSGVRILSPHLSEEQAISLLAMPGSAERYSLEAVLGGRGKHDPAPREFERVSMTFEVVMDYGAYRDVQRHRMATIIADPLIARLGWERPRDIDSFGLSGQFDKLMFAASDAYDQLVECGLGFEAQYVLPLAFRIRALMTANLRELFHFIELRSARQGHPSYRKIAQQMHEEVAKVYPSIAPYIRVNTNEFALTRD